jgi:HK97 family phage prohead protease
MSKNQKTQSSPERRYFSQEFRVSEGEAPKISGYAALFNSPSLDMGWTEEIDPHAFDGVMASNPDVRALWNHNPDHILGRTTAGTLRLMVDSRGLAYEIDPPATQLADDLIVSMRRKDVTGSSFGFVSKRDQWTENADGTVTRRILEFQELLDISPVTYPAYPATSSGVRSIPASMPVELRSRFETRDEEDGDNDNGCHCQCPECVGDNCMDCSDPDCDDPDCVANQNKDSRSQKRAFGQGCQCRCTQCRSGACGICSADDCADPECACYRCKPLSDSERRKMEMRLAIAKLSH